MKNETPIEPEFRRVDVMHISKFSEIDGHLYRAFCAAFDWANFRGLHGIKTTNLRLEENELRGLRRWSDLTLTCLIWNKEKTKPNTEN